VASPDIAHTSNKMWMTNLNTSSFVEWDITLHPWTATYVGTRAWPAGFTSSKGLWAINDYTLLAVNEINPASCTVVEINVLTGVMTTMFAIDANDIVSGDFMLTCNNKFIVSTFDSITNDVFVSQYDYITGNLDVQLNITGVLNFPFGIFQDGGKIYLGNHNSTGNIYWLENWPPYTLHTTPVGNAGLPIDGASQLPDECSCTYLGSTTTTSTTSTTTTSTTSTTSTTTTTTRFPSKCYTLQSGESGDVWFNYYDALGVFHFNEYIPTNSTITYCAEMNSIVQTGGSGTLVIVSVGVTCNGVSACTTTTTSTTSTTTTSTTSTTSSTTSTTSTTTTTTVPCVCLDLISSGPLNSYTTFFYEGCASDASATVSNSSTRVCYRQGTFVSYANYRGAVASTSLPGTLCSLSIGCPTTTTTSTTSTTTTSTTSTTSSTTSTTSTTTTTTLACKCFKFNALSLEELEYIDCNTFGANVKPLAVGYNELCAITVQSPLPKGVTLISNSDICADRYKCPDAPVNQPKCIIFTRVSNTGNPKITWTSPDGTVNYEVPWTWGGIDSEFHTCGYDVEVPSNITFTEGDDCDDNNPCPCNCIKIEIVSSLFDDEHTIDYTTCDGERILFYNPSFPGPALPGEIAYVCGYDANSNTLDYEVTEDFTNCGNCDTNLCLTIVDGEAPEITAFITFEILSDADLIDDLNNDYNWDVNQPMWGVTSSVPVDDIFFNYLDFYIGWNPDENRWEMINTDETNFFASTSNLERPVDSSWTPLTAFTTDFTTLSTAAVSCFPE
jgi:hypothetical protein